MPTKNLTLGLMLVISSTALAHTREHRVHKASSDGNGYVIRNGDFDWAIAHKHGISVSKLHTANPDVNWNALQVGIHIRIPGESYSTPLHHEVAEHHSSHSATRSYAIKDGDFDWILAHRAGITIRELKAMNPSVNWNHIHPGQHVLLPGSAVAEVSAHHIRGRYAKITGEAVRIHRSEGHNASVITTVDAGTLVKVLDHDGSWYRLRFPKGTEGWVKSEFLASASGPREASHHSRHHYDSYVAGRHRRHHHGNSGEYLALNDAPKNAVIQKALRLQGTPYVWGGSTSRGTDCSGLVIQAFKSKGIHLPRTSREQASVGKKVQKGHLQAGDLVMFHTGRGSRITHVGIYIGQGKFVHASSGGGKVQVNRLDSGYYANRFSTARRVLPSSGSKKSESSK